MIIIANEEPFLKYANGRQFRVPTESCRMCTCRECRHQLAYLNYPANRNIHTPAPAV